MPPFLFFFGVESWAAVHGLYRCAVYRLLPEPMSTRLLNSISSRICRQNTQFNMYTTTSKQQEGCTFKDSHPKCFITTNFDKFHREAFARGSKSRWCFDSMFPWYTKSKVNSNGVCNYYAWFYSTWTTIACYMVRYRWVRIRRKYAHDNQDSWCSSVDVFGTKARKDTYRI